MPASLQGFCAADPFFLAGKRSVQVGAAGPLGMAIRGLLWTMLLVTMLAGCSKPDRSIETPSPNPSNSAPNVLLRVDDALDALFVNPATANNADWNRLSAKVIDAGLGGGGTQRMGATSAGGYQNEKALATSVALTVGTKVRIGNGLDLMTDTPEEYVEFCTEPGQAVNVKIAIIDEPTNLEIQGSPFTFVNIESCP